MGGSNEALRKARNLSMPRSPLSCKCLSISSWMSCSRLVVMDIEGVVVFGSAKRHPLSCCVGFMGPVDSVVTWRHSRASDKVRFLPAAERSWTSMEVLCCLPCEAGDAFSRLDMLFVLAEGAMFVLSWIASRAFTEGYRRSCRQRRRNSDRFLRLRRESLLREKTIVARRRQEQGAGPDPGKSDAEDRTKCRKPPKCEVANQKA